MYSFNSRIRYSETDESGRLSLLAMVDYLQDCSTFQSESLGLGIEHMAATHLVWMLSNWEIEVDTLPTLGTEVKVSTWSHEITKVFGRRCFLLEGTDGCGYVKADSLWFLYDTVKGRTVQVPPEEALPYTRNAEPRLDMPELQRKVPVVGEGRTTSPVLIRRHYLDTNHHVNNARYIQMAAEALEPGLPVTRIQVQYRKPAILGDQVTPCVHVEDEGATVDLTGSEGESFATVRLFYRAR